MGSGDLIVQVDARGNNDPAAIERAVNRGIDAALKKRGADADYRRRS